MFVNKCVVVISQQGAPSVIVTCERPGPNITYPGSGSGSGGGAGAGMDANTGRTLCQ